MAKNIKELKIVMGNTNYNTKIIVGDEPIGLIQSLTFKADVNTIIPEIQITLVNPWIISTVLLGTWNRSLELLCDFPNVKIIY